MTTKTLTDTDTVQIITNKWLRDTRQFADNIDTLDKYGTINFALTTIGSSTLTTIVVNENVAVNANTDLTNYPNISWLFLGSGKLTPAVNVTLILYSPDTIMCPAYQQCLDASSGAITFYKGGWIHVGWFGVRPTQTASNNVAGLTKLFASIPSTGSGIYLCAGNIQVNDTLTVGDKPIRMVGVSPTVSILESTATSASKHGLQLTRSAHFENLQIKTSASLAANNSMRAISLNMDGVSASGQYARLLNTKLSGFNTGLYVDGGSNYNIDRLTLDDVDIQVSGPASDYVGHSLNLRRITQVQGKNVTLDQNNTGEHAALIWACKDVSLDAPKIRNATRGGASPIRLTGNNSGSGDDQRFPAWSITNPDIMNCTYGLTCEVGGTEKVGSLHVGHGRIDDIDSSVSYLGAIEVQALNSSVIESCTIDGLSIKDVGYRGVNFYTDASATLKRATVSNLYIENWSTASAGTQDVIGTSGTGTFGPIDLENIEANGNSNGRTIVSTAGQSSTISRISTRNLREVSTTGLARPIALATGDATPSMAIGNDFTQGNGSAQNVTAYDHLAPNQTYIVRFTSGNTTLIDGANLNLAGSTNYNPPANAVVTFYSPDGTVLWEVSRSAD